MIIQENQCVFDLAIQLNGTLENSIIDILSKYSIASFDEDLTNKNIDALFKTTSNIVNAFYVQNRNVVTSDTMPIVFQNIPYAEYSIEYSKDFDSF